ncbi:unnamed protein product [Cylindrotheca closterium]|uniref:Uncharacterized protein n=1 Tax=Cylindrotheca closterium TaxID=2856 RepID=A0AAD2FNM8_9STRA|nr:unnamed protein product [Cylindrotheca closterium]
MFNENDVPLERRKVALAFDSIITKKGIQWDVHGKMTGIDQNLHLAPIQTKFIKMKRTKKMRNTCKVSIVSKNTCQISLSIS